MFLGNTCEYRVTVICGGHSKKTECIPQFVMLNQNLPVLKLYKGPSLPFTKVLGQNYRFQKDSLQKNDDSKVVSDLTILARKEGKNVPRN